MIKIRCAIYTRKSSEEGLDQEFNSLDAQREACAAFIKSQKHEGWVLVPKCYDDGGLSGGNLQRPALKELMKDIDEGHIDQIVVYKIDRLTRSLSDFAKLVDRLDQQEASFVSVTQSFNTATSMGRLTLNVLLSFAQFEREVTAERIRDKIAASKKKGMWMGGTVPLGYDPNGRTLTINEIEAKTIRKLFDLYLTHKALSIVATQAHRTGLRSKSQTSKNGMGMMVAGKVMTASQIHHILTNPLYAGYIRHGNKIYDGLHEPIVQPEIFEQVQSIMKMQAPKGRGYNNKYCEPSLLMGKIFDENGKSLTTSHTSKKGQRYRYYVSKKEKEHQSKSSFKRETKWRLPADTFEKQITSTVINHLLVSYATDLITQPSSEQLKSIKVRLDDLNIATNNDCVKMVLNAVKSITLNTSELLIVFKNAALSELLKITERQFKPECYEFTVPYTSKKRGVETKLILGNNTHNNFDHTLIRNLAKANLYYSAIKQGQTFQQIADEHQTSKRQIQYLIELAFLSPKTVAEISRGEQSIGLTSQYLREISIPSNWDEQEKIFSSL